MIFYVKQQQTSSLNSQIHHIQHYHHYKQVILFKMLCCNLQLSLREIISMQLQLMHWNNIWQQLLASQWKTKCHMCIRRIPWRSTCQTYKGVHHTSVSSQEELSFPKIIQKPGCRGTFSQSSIPAHCESYVSSCQWSQNDARWTLDRRCERYMDHLAG